MAIIRGPDGKPIPERPEPTAPARRDAGDASPRREASRGSGDEPTRRVDRRRAGDPDDEPTVRVSPSSAPRVLRDEREPRLSRDVPRGDWEDEEPRTRLVGPPPKPRQQVERVDAQPGADAAAGDAMDDPVVGWLVVVDGPGRGASVPLGYGMNSIGRGPEARIRLDFGDEQISRAPHAVVTYDPRGRRFFLQQGGGKNLTYLADQPVLSPVELAGGEDIQLGATKLRFVPFCGQGFDWRDA